MSDPASHGRSGEGVVQRGVQVLWRRGGGVAVELIVNFALPLVVYSLAKPHWGEVKALIASSAPPIAWSIVELIRNRRLDFISVFVIAGIVLGLLAMIGGGGVKFLQLRERMVTVIIGLAFVVSALIDRPLILEFARASLRRSGSADLERIESFQNDKGFRAFMRRLSLVWGFGLLVEAAISVALVFNLTVRQYMIASPILGYTASGLLGGWTFLEVRRGRRIGETRRAAEKARLAAAGSTES